MITALAKWLAEADKKTINSSKHPHQDIYENWPQGETGHERAHKQKRFFPQMNADEHR